jgi:hypothetical protein
MKTNRNIFRILTVLMLVIIAFSSFTASKSDVAPKRKALLKQSSKVTYPVYRIVSNISSDNSQITFWVQGVYSSTQILPAPAPTYLTVTLTINTPAGTSYMNVPISTGTTSVTYPTGVPNTLHTGSYSITNVSPNSYNGYQIFFDGSTINLN